MSRGVRGEDPRHEVVIYDQFIRHGVQKKSSTRYTIRYEYTTAVLLYTTAHGIYMVANDIRCIFKYILWTLGLWGRMTAAVICNLV